MDQWLKSEPIFVLELGYIFTGSYHNLVAYIKKKEDKQTAK